MNNVQCSLVNIQPNNTKRVVGFIQILKTLDPMNQNTKCSVMLPTIAMIVNKYFRTVIFISEVTEKTIILNSDNFNKN